MSNLIMEYIKYYKYNFDVELLIYTLSLSLSKEEKGRTVTKFNIFDPPLGARGFQE